MSSDALSGDSTPIVAAGALEGCEVVNLGCLPVDGVATCPLRWDASHHTHTHPPLFYQPPYRVTSQSTAQQPPQPRGGAPCSLLQQDASNAAPALACRLSIAPPLDDDAGEDPELEDKPYTIYVFDAEPCIFGLVVCVSPPPHLPWMPLRGSCNSSPSPLDPAPLASAGRTEPPFLQEDPRRWPLPADPRGGSVACPQGAEGG